MIVTAVKNGRMRGVPHFVFEDAVAASVEFDSRVVRPVDFRKIGKRAIGNFMPGPVKRAAVAP